MVEEGKKEYEFETKISVKCSICNKEIDDDERMFNPMGDSNWYCADCWFHKTGERMAKKRKKYVPSFSMEFGST